MKTISLFSAIKSSFKLLRQDILITFPILFSSFGFIAYYSQVDLPKLIENVDLKLIIFALKVSLVHLFFYYMYMHFVINLDLNKRVDIPKSIIQSITTFPKLLFRLIIMGTPLGLTMFGTELLFKLANNSPLLGSPILKLIVATPLLILWLLTLIISLALVQITPIAMIEEKSTLKTQVSRFIQIVRLFPKQLVLLQSFNIYMQPVIIIVAILFRDIPVLGPSIFAGLIQGAGEAIVFTTGYFYYKQFKNYLPSEERVSVVA